MANYLQLKSEKPIAKIQKMYSLEDYNNSAYYVYGGTLSITFMTPQEISLMPEKLKKYSFGIRKEVFEYLQEKRRFPDINLLGDQNKIIGSSIFFMDGTALIRR